MVTRNYKRLLSMILESSGTSGRNVVPIIINSVTGACGYITSGFNVSSNVCFPSIVTINGTNSEANEGISVGSGGTPATETDLNLENTLTDVSVTLSNAKWKGNKYLDAIMECTVSVTNNGSEDIVVREIGYKQKIYVRRYDGGAGDSYSSSAIIVLLDRTVLESPITIAPGDTGIVVYQLTSSLYGQRSIDDIPIVSFRDGTDEEICAMIDAARQGKFDLHKDAGWSVGDYRTIHIDAFTGGGSTSHAAQDLDIVITSFDDYNDCGCLFQFDSLEALATKQRMNGSSAANYANSEMVSTTLPALEAALPSWLKTRLVTFDAPYYASASATELSTLSDQKLAIRGYREVYKGTGTGLPAEVLFPQYYYSSSASTVKQGKGSSSSGAGFTTRTPYNSSSYCLSSSSANSSATTANPISFFGCI